MPTPSGFNSGTLSNTVAATPIWWRLSASVSPPMPPPAMRMVMVRPFDCWRHGTAGGEGATAKDRCGAPGDGRGAAAPVTSRRLEEDKKMLKLYLAPGT